MFVAHMCPSATPHSHHQFVSGTYALDDSVPYTKPTRCILLCSCTIDTYIECLLNIETLRYNLCICFPMAKYARRSICHARLMFVILVYRISTTNSLNSSSIRTADNNHTSYHAILHLLQIHLYCRCCHPCLFSGCQSSEYWKLGYPLHIS